MEIADRYTFKVRYAFSELNSKVRNSRTEAISVETGLIFCLHLQLAHFRQAEE